MYESEDGQRRLWLNFDGQYQASKTSPVLLSLAKRHVRDDILDVGAGDGALIRNLHSMGFERVKGIDLAPATDIVEEASVTSIPYADEAFTTVFCTEVIEHLEPDQAVDGLREIHRVLRPGGNLIVTVPDREDMTLNQVTCPRCNHEFHRYGHHQVFDDRSFAELLARCGFKVLSLRPYALGAMSLVPAKRLFNLLFRRLNWNSVQITLVAIAQR